MNARNIHNTCELYDGRIYHILEAEQGYKQTRVRLFDNIVADG
jgi:hypothetical protein